MWVAMGLFYQMIPTNLTILYAKNCFLKICWNIYMGGLLKSVNFFLIRTVVCRDNMCPMFLKIWVYFRVSCHSFVTRLPYFVFVRGSQTVWACDNVVMNTLYIEHSRVILLRTLSICWLDAMQFVKKPILAKNLGHIWTLPWAWCAK